MRSLLLTLLLLPASLGAMEIAPFTAHYKVRFSGLGGEAVTTLSQRPDGSYTLENRTRALGIARLARPRDAVERSEFVLDGDNMRPVTFSSEDGTRRNKRGSKIDFDWDNGIAGTTYKGESRSTELQAGLLDRQLLQIRMMADLSNGVTDASYTVLDRHNKKVYEISVVGEERVDVPAGSYDALKVQRKRPGSSRSSIMWCAPSLGYLTIKMQQLKDGKVIATLALTDVK